MGHNLIRALLSTLAIAAVSTKPVQRRQTPTPLINEYIIQVKTALYVINSLQTGNFSDSCNDVGLATRLDGYGYDGEYAEQLLCEAAVGIEIFTDLDHAETDVSNALEALEALQRAPGGVGGPQIVASCGSVGVRTLNEAGLDGLSIRDALCQAVVESTSSVESDAAPSGPTLSQSATSTATASAMTTASGTSSIEINTSNGAPASFSNTFASRNPGNGTSTSSASTTASSVIVIAAPPLQTAVGSSTLISATASSGTAIGTFSTAISSGPSLSGSHTNSLSTVSATGSSFTPYYPYKPPVAANTSSSVVRTGTNPNTSSAILALVPANSTASYSPADTRISTSSTGLYYAPHAYGPTPSSTTNATTSARPILSLATAPAYSISRPTSHVSSVADAVQTNTTTPIPPSNSSASASTPSGCCAPNPLTSSTTNATNTSNTPLPPYFNLTRATEYTTQWVTGSSYPAATGIDPTSASDNEDGVTTVTVAITTTATVFVTTTVTPSWNGTGVYPGGTTGRPPWSWTGSWVSQTGGYEYSTESNGSPWSTDPLASIGFVSTKTAPSMTRPTGYGSSGRAVTRSSTTKSSTTIRPVYGHGPYGPIWTGKPVWTKNCTDGW